MELDVRHLRLVKAIAEAGSISGAAPSLGSTQPAVTRQLKRIEEGLGAPLFSRSRDGVEATELGRLVIGRADAALAIIDSLQADVTSAAAPDLPTHARVAARTGPLLVGLMQGLRDQVPDLEVTAESETRIGAVLELVATGQVDVALVREFVGFEVPLDSRLQSTAVECEDVVLLVAEDHPLAGRGVVDVADLAGESWLLSPLDVDREADCVTALCAAAGFAPRIVHYVGQGMAFELIRAGEGISQSLPRRVAGGTAAVRLRDDPVRVRHLLVTSRTGPFAGHVDALVPYVHRSLATSRSRAARGAS